MTQKEKDTKEFSFLNPYDTVGDLGIEEGMSVADFGSGAGHYSMAMADIVGKEGKVNAIDARISVLQVLEGHKNLDGTFQIKTIHANLEKERGSTLEDNSQDVVLCANILHQVDEAAAIIGEAFRVLKPGGRLIVIDWRENTPFGPPQKISENNIRKLTEEAGLAFEENPDFASSHYTIIFSKPTND